MTQLTIFTPSYNRADLLPRCYRSMQRQTCKDFIWMIIDDGSSDGTRELVMQWQREANDFRIEYYYKENGGLHTAYNEAISHIETPLCMCIDSDDWMPENAVENVLRCWEHRGSDSVAGIVGLYGDPNGKVIGELLPNQDTINLIDLLTGKYRIVNGDRTNVVRTELYKKYAPMKSFSGEKFFNPHYMHLQISKEYDFLVLNENLRYVEYQAGGMSASILKQYRNSPNSFAEIRKLYLSFDNTPLVFRIKNAIHLASSLILSRNVIAGIKDSRHELLVWLMLPFGLALAMLIMMKTH